ncbi:hypothetical protein [Phaffia rhodozyma]|uniref:Uncharacterized protein n=1 Tax=Phaffia rhodozyma TaxID=264483 RepID=A0A0F7SPH6_PHARH|nr:hypothetical protein [Phaffia rhodozyma]
MCINFPLLPFDVIFFCVNLLGLMILYSYVHLPSTIPFFLVSSLSLRPSISKRSSPGLNSLMSAYLPIFSHVILSTSTHTIVLFDLGLFHLYISFLCPPLYQSYFSLFIYFWSSFLRGVSVCGLTRIADRKTR